jgi:DNA-binding CsgD family transcriptional regulator
MQASDVETVMAHLAQFDESYSRKLTPALMVKLIQEKAISGLLIEKSHSSGNLSKAQLVTLGISAAIDLATAQHYLDQPPTDSIVDVLYEREIQNKPVFLRPTEVALANAGDGLALIPLHYSAPPGDPTSADVQESVMLIQSSFRYHNGGNHCRLLLHPSPSNTLSKESLIAQGFKPVGDGSHLLTFDLAMLKSLPFHPFSCLQRNKLPIFGFTAGEQDLLMLALFGRSDVDIAEDLHITRETVRKRWRAIYQRISDHPEEHLFPNLGMSETTRGPEKKSVVLRYLDSNLMEIRPYLKS